MNPPKNKYAIVLLANDSYLEYTKPVFYSAARYGNWCYDFILLAYEIHNYQKLEWFKTHNIKITHINRSMIPIQSIDSELIVYYAKFFLFNPYFNNYKKIIYLDTDIIIRKNLRSLIKYNGFRATDDYFCAPLIFQFNNYGEPYEKSEINKYLSKKTLLQTSFNTGVMIIDSTKNSFRTFNALIELANKYGRYSEYFEQGIINLYFLKTRKKLPYIYNNYYITAKKELPKRISRTTKHTVILHFIGRFKPWNKDSIYYDDWHQLYILAKPIQKWQFSFNRLKTGYFNLLKVDFDITYNIFQKKNMPIYIKKWDEILWQIETKFKNIYSLFISFFKK